MPWCPKCKNEYKEGVTVCSDCGCELVTGEEDIKVALMLSGTQKDMETLAEFLKYGGIEDAEACFDEGKKAYQVRVPEKALKKADGLVGIYYEQKCREQMNQKKQETETEEETVEEETVVERAGGKTATSYENSASKAEDNKSSAYTLLFVGVLGLLIVVLGIAGVLPIHLSSTTKYMTYGIMSALFLLFIVMGLISMKSYQIFAKKAESENSLRDTIEKWCLESFTQEELDDELAFGEENVSDEEKYFKRVSLMKEKIKKQFLNLDDAFLDNFVDDIYGDIFEEQ